MRRKVIQKTKSHASKVLLTLSCGHTKLVRENSRAAGAKMTYCNECAHVAARVSGVRA